MSKYQIPFSAGMHGEIDPAVLPNGALSSIVNGRQPRDGGIVKARGTTADNIGVTVSSAAVAGPVQGFAEFGGREWLAAAGRIYARGSGTGDDWQETGRAPRYFPVGEHWTQFDDTRGTSSTQTRPACATTGDYMALTWASASAAGDYTAFLRIMRPSGECVEIYSVETRYLCQVIAVGDYFIWAYKKSDDSAIYARRLLPGSGTLGSEITLESGIVLTADQWRVATHSATQWIYWKRDSAASIGWSLRGVDASLTQASSGNTPCANQVILRIESLSTAAAVYLAYADDTATVGGVCTVKALPPGLGASVGSAAIAASGDVLNFALIARDSTSAFIVFEQYSTGTQHALGVEYVTSTGSGSSPYATLKNVKLASRPFAATTSEIRLWVRVDNNVDATANLCALVTLQLAGANALVMQPELIPDSRPPSGFMEPTTVLALGSSFFFLAGVVVRSGIRPTIPALTTVETAPAMVFYEFEAASGVRMVDAAGAGYCFGGPGLVLASDRTGADDYVIANASGVEDGFWRRPECTMAATAGAGLTSGALYQAFVVYEYIDADIRRVRSAPSSLLTATPSGGNLQITLTIAVHPQTEREVSSVTHATAAHVYMTAANGSLFYRVTPDDGAPIAEPTNVYSFTYIQTGEPATTKELLYTLGNVIPNAPAPAHRHGVTAAGRGWAFGLFDPRVVECSKFVVPNEPLTWTRHPSFRTFAPIDVTCGDEIDGSIVLLGPDGVCLMPATGPNNQGQPALSAPVLVSRVGCIRPSSLLRSPQGLIYEGTRGMYRLPRGGGEPEYLGAGMMGEVASVSSATLVYSSLEDGRLPLALAAFAYTDADGARKVALLDPESGRWVGTDNRECSVVGTFGSKIVSDNAAGSALVIDADLVDSDPVETEITTGHMYPFGVLGHGDITRCQLLFTAKQTGVTLSCAMSIDGQPFEDAKPVILPALLPDSTPLASGQLHAAEWSVHPEHGGRTLSSVRFRFSDSAADPGAGVVYHGVALEGKAVDGLRKLPTGLRSA